MKKIGISALLALVTLAGCGDGGEKEAQIRLQKAEAALQQENFSEAKLQIDSIKVLYPKAFEARKQGIKLMQQVDLKEQGKTLVYLDSMILLKLILYLKKIRFIRKSVIGSIQLRWWKRMSVARSSVLR